MLDHKYDVKYVISYLQCIFFHTCIFLKNVKGNRQTKPFCRSNLFPQKIIKIK